MTDHDTPGDLDHVVAETPDEGVPEADPTTPERIIAAAARCFYRDGIYSTGVDALAAEAGISKRTLYNHFPSKDAVVAAYLRQREQQWQEKLHGIWEEVGDDPALQIVAYVRGYAHPVEDEVFRGSAFINAAAELSDAWGEALGVIQESMKHMEDGMARILATAGVRDAASVATRILYLVEGAVAVGGVRRDESCLRDAEYFIELLLEECGLSVEAVRAAS
ncbi:TetR/AcrR family transcriptional regulator [Nocardioides sp. AX2bis]|uniref:TetR/AcrR family transcriptional regulator n=1 Tax=Nocardioides sp. AX2bis TaxID=2653157 RepID=UPI0012F2E52E|nr:TetR/AcrR family transcriptional regulator [Nocardioides sp. AX2bis]VXC41076.1 putative TetR/AcrR family transcriptional regulator [Nocardioides sp. AX2bis]